MPDVSTELERHLREFEEATGLTTRVHAEPGQMFIVIETAPLPSGIYRIDRSDLLFIGDTQYPMSSLDMFWTEPAVVRANGDIPAGGDSIEFYLGRQWRRFSWHRNGLWNPGSNGILDHYEFVQDRFAKDSTP